MQNIKRINDETIVVDGDTYTKVIVDRADMPDSEKTYAARQAEWVKANGIEAGSKVKVLKSAKRFEQGFQLSFMPKMEAMVGKTFEVATISEVGISWHNGESTYFFPYFVLEVADKPVKEWEVTQFVIDSHIYCKNANGLFYPRLSSLPQGIEEATLINDLAEIHSIRYRQEVFTVGDWVKIESRKRFQIDSIAIDMDTAFAFLKGWIGNINLLFLTKIAPPVFHIGGTPVFEGDEYWSVFEENPIIAHKFTCVKDADFKIGEKVFLTEKVLSVEGVCGS